MSQLRAFNRFILISLALLGLSISSANAVVVSDLYGDKDGVVLDTGGGFGITDRFIAGDQSWTQTLDLSGLSSITSATIEISHWYDGWQGGGSQVLIGGISIGILTDLDGVGTPSHAIDLLSLMPAMASWAGGLFSVTIDTNVQGDGWYLDYSEISVTGVSAVPVPASIWLFGTALIGFVGMSRRRKVA